MNQRTSGTAFLGGRVQWGGYGFLAGIALGVLMGWMFSGFVGAFMRVALVLIAVIPLVMIYIAWRKFVSPLIQMTPPQDIQDRFEPAGAIESYGVVRGVVQEPHAR